MKNIILILPGAAAINTLFSISRMPGNHYTHQYLLRRRIIFQLWTFNCLLENSSRFPWANFRKGIHEQLQNWPSASLKNKKANKWSHFFLLTFFPIKIDISILKVSSWHHLKPVSFLITVTQIVLNFSLNQKLNNNKKWN